MEFTAWLREWLGRHPLKEPPELDGERFTAEVMSRVNTLSQPSQARGSQGTLHRWPFMRLGFVAAAAAAGIALIVGAIAQSKSQRADHSLHEAQLLAMIEDVDLAIQEAPEADDPEALAEEAEFTDQLTVLAEATPSDQQTIEQTLQLLEQLDEESFEGAVDDSSDRTLIEELQQLDEQEFSAT